MPRFPFVIVWSILVYISCEEHEPVCQDHLHNHKWQLCVWECVQKKELNLIEKKQRNTVM